MADEPMEMTISIESFRRVDLVTVSGRVDSSNASDLDDAFKGLADSGRYRYVVDLGEVPYMSSAGLRALVSAIRTNKKSGGDLRLTPPSDRVTEVLKLAGLDSIFVVYDDSTAAVGSY
jgi:anti-sigma B factor antagonist